MEGELEGMGCYEFVESRPFVIAHIPASSLPSAETDGGKRKRYVSFKVFEAPGEAVKMPTVAKFRREARGKDIVLPRGYRAEHGEELGRCDNVAVGKIKIQLPPELGIPAFKSVEFEDSDIVGSLHILG